MGNCLVTKLQSAISDISIKKLGEIHLSYIGNSESASKGVFNSDATLIVKVISGSGSFKVNDISHTEYVVPPNTDIYYGYCLDKTILSIISKYNLKDLPNSMSIEEQSLRAIKFCNFSSLNLASFDISGTIEDFLTLKRLKYLDITNCPNISGNIELLSGLPNLESLYFGTTSRTIQTNIYGDISVFYGDKLTAIGVYCYDGGTYNVSTPILATLLSNCPNVEKVRHYDLNDDLGDLSLINNSKVYYIYTGKRNITASWSNRNNISGVVMSIISDLGVIDFGDDLDNYLLANAARNLSSNTVLSNMYQGGTIRINGNETNSTEEIQAIDALIDKGLTVIINKVTKSHS